MLSRKTVAAISIAALVVFSIITIETIGNSGSSMTSSTGSTSISSVQVYSPQNGSAIYAYSANSTISVTLSVTSNESKIYVYDVSPSNLSALPKAPGIQLYSIPNLTFMNKTLYPYNYQTANVTAGVNTTLNVTLYLNPTLFNEMNVSNPHNGHIYPYVVEMLVETSSGASGIGFSLIKL